MWAVDDWTKENGATSLVLGSHRRQKSEGYDLFDTAPDTAVVADCPKGSVVVFLGHTIHTGGRNTSNNPRTGLNVDYCLAWLRQECNQYLDVPPSIARDLPTNIRELIGYTRVHQTLGYYGAFTDPEEALREGSSLRRTDRSKL